MMTLFPNLLGWKRRFALSYSSKTESVNKKQKTHSTDTTALISYKTNDNAISVSDLLMWSKHQVQQHEIEEIAIILSRCKEGFRKKGLKSEEEFIDNMLEAEDIYRKEQAARYMGRILPGWVSASETDGPSIFFPKKCMGGRSSSHLCCFCSSEGFSILQDNILPCLSFWVKDPLGLSPVHTEARHARPDPTMVHLIENIMRLPKELRHMIYRLIFFQWYPNKQHPITKHDRYINACFVARRNLRPMFQDRTIVKTAVSADSKRREEHEDYYKQHQGMIDYFGNAEYRCMEALLDALALFEGRSHDCTSKSDHSRNIEYHDPRKQHIRSLGLLNDVLAWLWDNIVVDISDHARTRGMKQDFWPSKEFGYKTNYYQDMEENIEHAQIVHLTFEIKPVTVFDEDADDAVCHLQHLIDICEFCKYHLPGLRTIRLFLQLNITQSRYFLENYNSLIWIHAINDLPVAEQFYFTFIVKRDDKATLEKRGITSKDEEDKELNELGEAVTKILHKKLRPISLRGQGNDVGLSEGLNKLCLGEET